MVNRLRGVLFCAIVAAPDDVGIDEKVGHDRFATERVYALLGELYPLLCLQLNFFRPIRKGVAKGTHWLMYAEALRPTTHCLPTPP